MTVKELVEKISTLPDEYQECEVVFRHVGADSNFDFKVESARIDIIGGPIVADARYAVVLREF